MKITSYNYKSLNLTKQQVRNMMFGKKYTCHSCGETKPVNGLGNSDCQLADDLENYGGFVITNCFKCHIDRTLRPEELNPPLEVIIKVYTINSFNPHDDQEEIEINSLKEYKEYLRKEYPSECLSYAIDSLNQIKEFSDSIGLHDMQGTSCIDCNRGNAWRQNTYILKT